MPMPRPAYDDTPPTGGDRVAGKIIWEIAKLEIDFTNSNRRCLKAEYTGIEPAEAVGATCFETYTIGTELDPEAKDPKTLTSGKVPYGYKLYRDMLKAAKVGDERDFEKDCKKAPGKRFLGVTTVEVQGINNKNGTRNDFAGRTSTRITKYLEVGSHAPSFFASVVEAAEKRRDAILRAVEDGTDGVDEPAAGATTTRASSGSRAPQAAARPQ